MNEVYNDDKDEKEEYYNYDINYIPLKMINENKFNKIVSEKLEIKIKIEEKNNKYFFRYTYIIFD